MRTTQEMSLYLLGHAYRALKDNLRGLTLAEALFVPQGGYRSVLGTLKHTAGWSHVYRSYAFDPEPRHWTQIAWPYGLRDTIIKSEPYLQSVIAWFDEAHQQWLADLGRLGEDHWEAPRPLHWGQQAPLSHIVVIIAGHHLYHAGELNQVLSICRGEAWEDGEEVEENNISTIGHRVRPPWLDRQPTEEA